MSDKTREEFEEWFESTGINSTFSEVLFAPWKAAKEKYEPRWIPVSERFPEIDQYVVWSCDDGYMIFAKRDKDDPVGYWEARFTHWAVIEAPSTQGGGE